MPRLLVRLACALLTLSCSSLLLTAPGLAQAQPDAAASITASATAPPALLREAPAGTPALARAPDLRPRGFVEQEYTLHGQAQAYSQVGEWGEDGRWSFIPRGARQPFTTRLLVRRPTDNARFSGTVIVEWLNTALGSDLDAGWALMGEEILREGHAWIGVTVQEAGVQGLQEHSVPRYAALRIASNDLSFDIYAQAGQTVRQQLPQLLGEHRPLKTLLAFGYSESAFYLSTYLNTLQAPPGPYQALYDGFLLHGGPPFSAPLDASKWPHRKPMVRADLSTPVMRLQTQMEVAVSWSLSDTPDTHQVRYWEVAGASHFGRDLQLALRDAPGTKLGAAQDCLRPINTVPVQHIDQAALHALIRWVQFRTPPPVAPRMARNALGFVTGDDHGNALGGVRLPELDVPTARHGMYANVATRFNRQAQYDCIAGGSTRPLDANTLRKLYGTPQAYARLYRQAADAAMAAGFLRPADHARALAQALAFGF